MTITELETNPNYKYHHTGSRQGYESRKSEGHIEPYNGRFGKGYIIVRPRRDTTMYVWLDYYIEV